MPQAANRTHSRSHSTSSSDDENVPPLSLDTSKEALIKVSYLAITINDTQSCDRISEIARQHQARKNTLSQENEALRRKLTDISNNNDTEPTRRQKRRRTHSSTHTGTDSDHVNETLDDTSTGQAEDEFVNNVGHKFCIIYALWVRKGTDIFTIKLDDTYDATQRFENDDNKVQGQLQEIVSLLQERLDQDVILDQRWVRRDV
jgi:hypothetical protein